MALNSSPLGRDRIIERVWAGGMALVYKAYQPDLDRYVAIKVLSEQLAFTAGFKERFIREARAVARLSHPNILPIYDVGFESGHSYFVMKYVSGHQTLDDFLPDQPLALPTVSHFIEQIAGALDHAHGQNIIHRDVKPSNVLVENDWLMLADFGLAKMGVGSQDITKAGTVIGTPNYLSPEQAAGKSIDFRADVYSLGVVLYQMVLGHVPYESETPWGILYQHIHEPVPRPRRLKPDLPPEIEAIILKALDKDPAKRYEQAGELAEALQAQLHDNLPLTSASNILSEDGDTFTDSNTLHPPQPQFDPRLLDTLEAPGGVIKLRDKFYIERQGDEQLKREVIRTGTTTTIRASRQTGKSSLLVRGASYARENGAKVVNLDLQRVDGDRLATPDLFLRDLAELMVRKLRLDVAEIENFWQGSLGVQDKLTYLMEDYVLPEIDTPIVLALDEVDRLLQTPFHSDFFALLRFWHNSRAMDEQWDKLNMVLVISTEPYLLIKEVNQSPFNVGLKIYLEDFDEEQVRDLNERHGGPVSDTDFPELMELLGGHPYLTRQALYMLTIEQLIWPDLLQTADLDHGPFGDHLRHHHWSLHNEPGLGEAFKQIIENGHSADETARFRLLQAGLIKGSGDVYACRCDLDRLYFKDKL